MKTQRKKKYEKPRLLGEKIFEGIALACCKASGNCGTNSTKNTTCAPNTSS